MPGANHPLRILEITVAVFLMGYFLERFGQISSIIGDYFTISTELLPLVLSFSIFGITWYSYRRSKDNHSLFLGAAFFIIGLFDFFHLLSYPFMPDFITPNSPQKSVIFWGEARFVSALLFLASAYIYKDTLAGRITKSTLFVSSVVFSFTVLAATLFYPGSQGYLPQDKLSSAGVLLAIVTAAITAYAGYLYSRRLKETGQKNLICLIYGLTLVIFSLPAYFFNEYPEHLLRGAGFYFVYNAIYQSSIDQPYEKLRQVTEEKYRMLVENIQDGVFIIQDAKIQFVNEAFARVAGYRAEEIIGRDFREFIAPEDVKMVTERYFQRQAGDDAPKEYEFRVLRRDGKRMTVHMNIGLITYRGRIASMGTMRDITERKQAEEALSWQVEINVAMVELSSTLLSPATVEEISALVLEHAKLLTNSPYGYVGYIDPKTGYLVCPTMSRDMMDICKVRDKNNILKDFKGLFGWVLTNGKSILTNSPANDPRSSGTPPGHIPIHRFLSAPALLKRKLVGELSVASSVGNKIHVMRYYDRGNLVGQIALANSDRDYTERDLALVERLADIYAIAINRYWAEEQIKESLKEKEVLLREIHHRVKNNMQIISSLLRLQSRDITEQKYVEMFMESQNRITSMALIHEKLYQSKGLVKIDFNDYIRDLATGLFQSYGVNGRIGLCIDVREVSLGIDSAIPCGLIVNELVTNSLKHAFPEERKGEIKIKLYPTGENNTIELMISDNGVSIPESVDIRKTESLGLHLVTILVENQLHGEINLNRSKGTEFLIKFKDVK